MPRPPPWPFFLVHGFFLSDPRSRVHFFGGRAISQSFRTLRKFLCIRKTLSLNQISSIHHPLWLQLWSPRGLPLRSAWICVALFQVLFTFIYHCFWPVVAALCPWVAQRLLTHDTRKNTVWLWSEIRVRRGAGQRSDAELGCVSRLRHGWHKRRQSDHFTDFGNASSTVTTSRQIASG